MKLSPHCLTAVVRFFGIQSLVGFGTRVRALVHPVLYLRKLTHDASPKAISKRTGNHEVLLAFHPYPQLIQAVFNQHWFGPPSAVTPTSSWPRVDHPASRLFPATPSPCSDSLSLRLAYA